MTPIPEAAVEAGAKAMATDQMRSVLHAAWLEFSPAQDTLIRYWARLAVEAAAPLIARSDGAVEAAMLAEREACARVIEEGQETSSTGRHTDGLSVMSLTPRRHGNTAGLAYADAIRARSASPKPGSGV